MSLNQNKTSANAKNTDLESELSASGFNRPAHTQIVDQDMDAAEAEQAYEFRDQAFSLMKGKISFFLWAWTIFATFGGIFLVVCFCAGLFYDQGVPEFPHELYYLLVILILSSGVLLLVASVTALNFSRNCHTRNKNTDDRQIDLLAVIRAIGALLAKSLPPTS